MRRGVLPGVLVLTMGLLLGLFPAVPASAAVVTRTWVGGSGLWSTGSNWDPAGQPGDGDTVNLTQSDATDRTVEYYNTLYPSAVLNSLTIDATGPGTMTLWQWRHSLSATGYEFIGHSGTGTFTQTGGTNTISGILYLGFFGKGTYNLSGTGSSLSAGEEDISVYGTGSFTQSGGSNTISTDLYLGGTPGSSGTYSISAGNLEVTDFSVGSSGGSGTLKITGPAANITVSDKLSFGPASTLTAVPGATIHMTGSAFENESTDPTALAGLSNLELVFEGGNADIDPFEVAGKDLGAVMAGFDNNFALGTLTLGGTDIGNIELADLFDNQPGWTGNEALYVYNLNIGAGSALDLNGLNLYYLNGSIAPGATINYSGGSLTDLTPIPEPATFLLLGTGLLGLIGYTRKKISRA